MEKSCGDCSFRHSWLQNSKRYGQDPNPASLGLISVSKKQQNISSTLNTLTAAGDRPFFSPFIGCSVNLSDSTCFDQLEPVMANSSTLVC